MFVRDSVSVNPFRLLAHMKPIGMARLIAHMTKSMGSMTISISMSNFDFTFQHVSISSVNPEWVANHIFFNALSRGHICFEIEGH